MEAQGEGKYHRILAIYFVGKFLYLDEPTRKQPNTRKLVEQPWQQTKAKKMWDEVTVTLCNLDFIQAKAAAKMTYELVKDFNHVFEAIPDNEEIFHKEIERHDRIVKYTKDLIAFAEGKISELIIPESITPWDKEQILENIEQIKINPGNIDKLKDFSVFIGNKASIFQKYACSTPHLVCQEAWNYANYGPVGKLAETVSIEIKNSLLLLNQNSRPEWNPLPQALKVLQDFEDDKSSFNDISSIAISPDGKRAVTGGWSKCLFWSLTTGEVSQRLKGKRSDTPVINIYGKEVFQLIDGHTSKITSISITPDCKYAFSGSFDNTCILWDLINGRLINTFKGHALGISSVSITPDGKWAISGSSDKTCILWDLKKGEKSQILEDHSTGINSVSITADGKFAISSSDGRENNCILWNLVNGNKQILNTYNNYISRVYITPDGSKAIGINYSFLIRWDLITKNEVHTNTGSPISFGKNIAFTPDGRKAFSGGKDNNCCLWDLTTGKILLNLVGHKSYVYAFDITPDGKYGISGSNDGSCILWDLEKGVSLNKGNNNLADYGTVSFTPDYLKVLYGLKDSHLNPLCSLWNLKADTIEQTFYASDIRNPLGYSIYNYTVNTILITPNGQRATFSLREGSTESEVSHNEFIRLIILFDLVRNQKFQNLIGHNSYISDLAITPNGRYAISSSRDETCILWDLENGQSIHSYIGHSFDVGAKRYNGHGLFIDKICISPDGKLAIFSTSGAGSRVWNIDKVVAQNIVISKGKAYAISPDGKSIVTFFPWYGDNSIKIWNLKTGELTQTLNGHSSLINATIYNPDSKRIISVSKDGTCIVWDLAKGEVLSRFVSASDILSINYMPDGLFLGCQFGEAMILYSSRNLLCPSIAITTIRQIWDFELKKYSNPLIFCPLCGHCFDSAFALIRTILEILHKYNIQPEQSPCLELPDEAWEDPALIGECPACREKLKINPFFGTDTKEIEEFMRLYENEFKYQHLLDDADKAFSEENWGEAYKIYIKLVQQGKFDPNHLRFNMAICQINGMATLDPKIVSDVEFLMTLLRENGGEEKARLISNKLEHHIDILKGEELIKNNAQKRPWWMKLI